MKCMNLFLWLKMLRNTFFFFFKVVEWWNMLSGCTCYAKLSSNGNKTPAFFSHQYCTRFIPLMYLFSYQLCIFTPDTELKFPFMLFYRQCTAVTSLFSQVEVGDIIIINCSDFVPADAVILSSRYRSPLCCQTVGNFSLLSPFLRFAQLSLKKWWLDTSSQYCQSCLKSCIWKSEF